MRETMIALFALLAVSTARVIITSESQETPHQLGAKMCTWGPTYWCQNITTASGCAATQHCIKKVWETMEVPNDTDSVCGICKDMVKQARDQLESPETLNDLKAVFEGSCALMKIKTIVIECDKLVDQFIPDLVETLASQMDPSVVCSVAGLCNSAHIDHLIEEHDRLLREAGSKALSLSDDELEPDNCSRCYTIAAHMEKKLNGASRDGVLERMLVMCGEMSSFSDACSSIVLEYFSTIYSHLQDNFKAKNICHLSGQCSGRFHKHEEPGKDLEVEIRPLSSVGMVEVGDDLPCKLCEQLVGHLKELLVANTTEIEFKQVLEGLCKQTKSFASECESIVDQYYKDIYNYLIKGLNTNSVCEMAGICPLPGKDLYDGPIRPLLPVNTYEIGVRVMNKRKNLGENGAGIRKETKKPTEADEMQLPIDKLLGSSVIIGAPQMDLQGQQTCAFCEYLMHYLQQIVTQPVVEDDLKRMMGKVCHKLPESVQATCTEFLDTYGDAVMALLAEQIDPSVVCPMIHVCPSEEFINAWEQIPKSIMLKSEVEDKPSCPLCLLAVGQLYSVIKENKTESNIEHALDKLCIHLPKDLVIQCESFVKGYSKELVDMLLADLSPQEVCVYIKLCQPNTDPGPKSFFPVDDDGEILTNEIPDYPVPVKKSVQDDTKCVICEFFMQYVEKALGKKSNKEEIEKVVHSVCDHLPKSVSHECNQFVDQYADVVIDLLTQEVSPKEICTVLGACQEDMQRLHDSIAECALCQAIISTIDNLLADPSVDAKLEEVVSRVCRYLPAAKQGKCTMMMEVYEQSIINILRKHGDSKKVCSTLRMCSAGDFYAMKSGGHNRMARSTNEHKRCTWGEVYYCRNNETAAECNMEEHCRTNVWKGDSPPVASLGTK